MTPVELILAGLAVAAFVGVAIAFWLAWRLAGAVDTLTARVSRLESPRGPDEGW